MREADTWWGSCGQEVSVVAGYHSQGLVSSQCGEVVQECFEAKTVKGGVTGCESNCKASTFEGCQLQNIIISLIKDYEI